MRSAVVFGAGIAANLVDLPAVWPTRDGQPIQLLGHRGLKSQMPEHTLGSYWLAATNGADFVEPDLMLTKDKVPVCYHDMYIRDTTDVEAFPRFRNRRRNFTGVVDGKPTVITDQFFISDFTLAELQLLHVVQKDVGVRPQYFNNVFHIVSLEEFLVEMHRVAARLNRTVSIAPEVKHPAHHNALFPDQRFEDRVLAILRKHGYPLRAHHAPRCMAGSAPIACGRLMVQSFDYESLTYLSSRLDLAVVELVMLNDDDPFFYTPQGLRDLATRANWISVWKEFLFLGPAAQFDAAKLAYSPPQIRRWGGFLDKGAFVALAHQLGLKIALYTFYDSREKSYRGCAVRCEPEDARAEYRYYFKMGIDAMFVENVNEAIQARTEFNTQLRYLD